MSVATQAPIKGGVLRAKDGKIGFHSKITNRIVWKMEADMTDEERVWARLPALEGNGEYEAEIEFCQQMADDARERQRYAQGVDRHKITNEIYQWQLAQENYREASLIPVGTDVTFGYAPHYRGHFRMPPNIPGYEPEPITFPFHTYRTSDPVRIAWLRRHIRERTNENLVELSANTELVDLYGKDGVHRLDAVVSMETGRLVDWMPYETVNKMRENGVAKGDAYHPKAAE